MPDIPDSTTFESLIHQGILEIGDGYRAKLEELGGNGPIFLRAGCMSDRGFEWSAAERFKESVVGRVAAKFGRPGDTVITTKGNSVGRTGYIPPGAPAFVYSPHLSYWRCLDPSRIAPRFLRYWSESPEFLSQLRAMAHGTDMAPYLSLVDQRRLRISVPSIERQVAVGEMLGALDDKIALNQRIASTCAKLAEAKFRSFMDRCYPKLDMRPLGELVEHVPGRYLPRDDYASGGEFTVYGSNSIMGTHTRYSHEGPLTVMARIGSNCGALMWSSRPAWVNNNATGLRARSSMHPWFVHQLLATVDMDRHRAGSGQPFIRIESLLSHPVPTPSPEEQGNIGSLLKDISESADVRVMENRVLAELRDALLPKLISGELRIKGAESLVASTI